MTAYATLRPDDITVGTPVITLKSSDDDPAIIYTDVVGTEHYPDAVKALIGRPAPDHPDYKLASKSFILVRDPYNRHDPNALQVWSPGHGQIGYVPRDDAAALAASIDFAVYNVAATAQSIPALKVTGDYSAFFSDLSCDDDGNDITVPWYIDDLSTTLAISPNAKLRYAQSVGKQSRFPGIVAAPPPPAAGWYADPTDPSQNRYWDGATWTEHRSPR